MRRTALVLTCLIAAGGLAVAFAADDPFAGINFDASRVSLDLRDRPITEALRQLAEQSGNWPLKLSGKTLDVPVTLKVANVPYWQAVDELCRAAGMMRGWSYLSRAGKLEAPTAVAGPVILSVVGMKSETVFRDERPPGVTRPAQPASRLYYTIEYQFEERLPLLWHRGRVTRVIGDDGRPVPVEEGGWNPWSGSAPAAWRGLARSGDSVLGSIFLCPRAIAPGLKKLATVEGVVDAEFGAGEKTISVADPFGQKEIRLEGDRFALVVESLRMQDKDAVMRIRVVTAEPLVLKHFSDRYGLFLAGADGVRFSASVTSSSGHGVLGAEELRKAGIRGEIGPEGGEEVALGAGFYRIDPAKAPWTLLFIYPESRVRREYPFVIRDVPAP